MRDNHFMGQDDPIAGVLKFGTRQHIERLAQGLLHMNTLEYFIKLETCSLRGDPHEGTSQIFRGDGATLQIMIEGQFRPVGELKGPLRYRSDENLKVNVFCMYAIREGPSGTFVDPRNFDFGDTFAIFTDFDEFMKRVQAALAGTGQMAQWSPVDYIDSASYAGPAGIFKKDSIFSYQSELRLALLPGYGSRQELEVGDLSDIVVVGTSKDLQNIKLQRYQKTADP